MRGPKLTNLAHGLPATVPFVGPEHQERSRDAPFLARLGANELLFGPSPNAVEAMRQAAADAWMYGDPEMHDLRTALADHLGVAPEHIAIGEGIDGLLGLVVRLLIAPGDRVLTSAGAYPTFNYHVAGFGGELLTVPYRDDHEDTGALALAAREAGAKIVYLANPDNPMGTMVEAEEVARLLDDLPEGCLLVLDEAYAEFAPAVALPQVDAHDPRVLRMRTFSKAYGMAGARVGYAVGHPEFISAFDKVRNHFGVNRIAQAGALAALADQEWLARIVQKVGQARNAISAIAAENGLKALPSHTNFVAIDCGGDGDFARAVLQYLVQQGIFVRMPAVAPLDRCIRVTCGPADQLEQFSESFPAALSAARKKLR